MARLSEREKAQSRLAAQRPAPVPPKPALRPVGDFVEFATWVSALKQVPKPVRFEGQHWKL
jgi:hypothetical protein